MAVPKASSSIEIQLPQLNLKDIIIPIVGETSLVVHRWTEKAIKEILDKQMKVAKSGREAKDPIKEYQDSMYRMPDGRHGFPSVAFKNAAVTACTSLSGVTKVSARQAFRVIGETAITKTVFNGSEMRQNLVEILGDYQLAKETSPDSEGKVQTYLPAEPEMREDMVRIGMGTADIRYRAQYVNWRCNLLVRYNANVLSSQQVVNLFNTAGFAVGVGEWRQEKNGEYGSFRVELASENGNGSKEEKKSSKKGK